MSKLGRGLEALIGSGPESFDNDTGVITLKINSIVPSRFQPRRDFDKKKLQELADSLKENGIIQPIIVMKHDDSKYEIIAGERRLEASKIAGFTEVPVIIRKVTPKEQLQIAIIENVQREDLNAIEEAKAYQQLHEEFKLTHSQISNLVGKDRVTITNFIRLLKLNNDIQQKLLNAQLTPGHARAILQIDPKLRSEFAELIVKNLYSVRRAEIEARKINERGSIKKTIQKQPTPKSIKKYEKILTSKYGVKVKISKTEQKGKITLFYNSQKEFESLMTKLEE